MWFIIITNTFLKLWIPLVTYMRLKAQYMFSEIQANKGTSDIEKMPGMGWWRGKVRVLNARFPVHISSPQNNRNGKSHDRSGVAKGDSKNSTIKTQSDSPRKLPACASLLEISFEHPCQFVVKRRWRHSLPALIFPLIAAFQCKLIG